MHKKYLSGSPGGPVAALFISAVGGERLVFSFFFLHLALRNMCVCVTYEPHACSMGESPLNSKDSAAAFKKNKIKGLET